MSVCARPNHIHI
jgi:hypothetical protein